jgi:hypothetical protein
MCIRMKCLFWVKYWGLVFSDAETAATPTHPNGILKFPILTTPISCVLGQALLLDRCSRHPLYPTSKSRRLWTSRSSRRLISQRRGRVPRLEATGAWPTLPMQGFWILDYKESQPTLNPWSSIRDFQLKKYRIPREAEGVTVVLSP